MTRRVLSALLTAALVVVLAACGEKDEPTSRPLQARWPSASTLLLDYLPNADHAGIYGAIGGGEFVGRAAKGPPRTPSDPSLPLKLLAAGGPNLAISYQPELLLARSKARSSSRSARSYRSR